MAKVICVLIFSWVIDQGHTRDVENDDKTTPYFRRLEPAHGAELTM